MLVALVYIPFNYYLSYLILIRIQASDLMWFLYWITLPISIVSSIVTSILTGMKKEES
jgi:hypothetical protein